MTYRRPKGWNISPFDRKNHYFRTAEFAFSDDESSKLTIGISPFCSNDQRIAIASQAQVLWDSYIDVKPSKAEFIQALKATRNNDPNALEPYLWTSEDLTNSALRIARLAFVIQSKLDLAQVVQLAQTKLVGKMTPDLLDVLEGVKTDPLRGLEIALCGSLSELEGYVEKILDPFLDKMSAEMAKEDSTSSSVQDVIDSSLSILGSAQGGVHIEAELLLKDVNFNKDRDISIIGLSGLYIAGSYTNERSMMASIVIQLLLYHAAYNAKIYSEVLVKILDYGRSEDEPLGRVVLVTGSTPATSAKAAKIIVSTASLSASIFGPADLLAECQVDGKIGKVMNPKSSIMYKKSKIRKEYAACPQFVELAKKVGYSN